MHDEIDEFADLQPGTRLGPYVIVDRLGRGGMGQVFLGRDQELHRKVALKCLFSSSRPDDGTDRARILHEARAAAAISHANVAAVYHVIEHGSRAFIVMEYVEGETLATRLTRERMPPDRVVAIARQLTAALIAAHARGIVHRDLKPANIQITSGGSVKVLDFGVANATRALSGSSEATTALTPPVQLLADRVHGGTLPYMSPEQLIGGQVDERSDLYSLGVVLFEMATGRRPFHGSDPLTLVEAQGKGAPRANAVDPGVSAALADIIATALEADLARRYQSAAEVALALDRVDARLGLEASGRELHSSRLARIAIGTLTAILAIGLVGFITTTGFNLTFGRTGAFAAERWPAYFDWGVSAMLPSVVIMTITAVIAMGVGFIFRTLEIVGPIGRAARRVRTDARTMALRVGLDKSAVLAQALSGLAIVALAVLCWYHAGLITAWTSFFNSSSIDTLLPMAPEKKARLGYRVALDVMTLAFSFGLFRVIQLRKREGARAGTAAVALLTAVIAVMVLMNEWPYRTFLHQDFERVEFAGDRCYVTGESVDELLILCPAGNPPRNRTIRRDDPKLHRSGELENVFAGVSRPGSRP